MVNFERVSPILNCANLRALVLIDQVALLAGDWLASLLVHGLILCRAAILLGRDALLLTLGETLRQANRMILR